MSKWQPIDTAPRDGTHILACQAGTSFGWFDGQKAPAVQSVVHYWASPGEEGFYTSVNELEPQRTFDASHWKPLDDPSADADPVPTLINAVGYCIDSLKVVLVDQLVRGGMPRDEAEKMDWAEWSHPANSIRAALAAVERARAT